MLVKVFSTTGNHYVLKSSCVVYSVAAAALAITIGFTIGWKDEVLYGGWISLKGGTL